MSRVDRVIWTATGFFVAGIIFASGARVALSYTFREVERTGISEYGNRRIVGHVETRVETKTEEWKEVGK